MHGETVKSLISNFMETCPVRAKFSHADGRTDRHNEVNSRCSQFLLKKNSYMLKFGKCRAAIYK